MTYTEAKSFVEDHAEELSQIRKLLRASSEKPVDLVSEDFAPYELTSSDAHAALTRLYFWRHATCDSVLIEARWKADQRPHGGIFSLADGTEVRLLKCPPNVTELPEAREGVEPLFSRAPNDEELPFSWRDDRIQHAIYWDADQYGVITKANFVIGFDLSSTNATVLTEYPLPSKNTVTETQTSGVDTRAAHRNPADPFDIFLQDAEADSGTNTTH